MEKVEKESKSIQIFSSFVLKLIAIISMTFDHVGQALLSFYPYGSSTIITNLYLAFKIIGRIALPIFLFMIVEGMKYTKNKSKYIMRLGVEALFISIILLIMYYVPINGARAATESGNIFIDLLFSALAIYCLQQEDKKKYLWIIPILLFSIASYTVKCYEIANSCQILFFPNYIRFQYDWYSLIIVIAFFVARYFINEYYKYQEKITGIEANFWEGTNQKQNLINLCSFGIVIILTAIMWLIYRLAPNSCYYDGNIQSYAVIGGALLLFYNGKRGYNAKWFQYGCYLYYPLHIGIIILIFGLVWGL